MALVAAVEIDDCFAQRLDVDLELRGVVHTWPDEKEQVVLE